MKVRAVLFDIDGTLIDTGGAGRRALTRAFFAIYGIRNAFNEDNFTGRTDPEIIERGFRRFFSRQPTKEEIDHIIFFYLEFLKEEVERSKGFRVLPGVDRLLEALHKETILGLCTGNVEEGARIKLQRGGLNRFFSFGGFSSDSPDRTVLTRIAIERAKRIGGGDIEPIIVGDSVYDYHAARGCNAYIALVGTGWNSKEVLKSLKPDLFFESFSDTERCAFFLKYIWQDCSQVHQACRTLSEGGVIIHPTSTLYGLACDAFREDAVRRINDIKGNRVSPYIILVKDLDFAQTLCKEIPEKARRLAERLWPGPVTLVLRANTDIPSYLVSLDKTIAIRVDPHPFVASMLSQFPNPIISTSANFTGAPPPHIFEDIHPSVLSRVDMTFKTNENLLGIPSTVVRIDGNQIEILREGAISMDVIYQIAGNSIE